LKMVGMSTRRESEREKERVRVREIDTYVRLGSRGRGSR